MIIERQVDIEDVVRVALSDYLTVYVRPLPASFALPSILVTQVGGNENDKIDSFDVVLDARAETEAEAMTYLRNAIGLLKSISSNQTSEIRDVTVNSSGSWGVDPVRPELAMCSARIRVVAHPENYNFGG